MPRRTTVALASTLVALAGCGSSNKAASTSPTKSATKATQPLAPGATEIGTPPPVKSVTYRVRLSGTDGSPKGAPNGSALGILSIKASSSELCWQLSQLKNVEAPTRVRIYRSLAGGSGVGAGITLGSTFKPASCVHEPPVLLGLLGKTPKNFFLSVDSARFPHGAVRGRP